MSSKNKYKDLLSNTLLFALGTFGSKLLVLMVTTPLYTRILSPSEFGLIDILTGICNLLIPIICVSINEAIIRFGVDKSIEKSDVYTSGMVVTLGGFVILLLCYPLFQKVDSVAPYTSLMMLYVIASILRANTNHFVRAIGHVKLFAVDGMVTILTTIGFNLIFLLGFGWGVKGYLLATICGDTLSAIMLTMIAKTYQYFDVKHLDKSVLKKMLAYAIPLVPTAISWWITSLSDRFVIKYFMTLADNGIYNISNKMPQFLTIVSTIFIQAWQLSAFQEHDSEEGQAFFSDIFRSYYTVIFLAVSGLVLLIKPMTRMLASPDFFEGWRYAPFLILGTGFSCLVTFLGTVYNTAKKNGMVSFTTFLGAIVNIVMNILLVPIFGMQGAAFATFFSFFIVFVIRAIDCQKYMKIVMRPWRIAISLVLLLIQIFVAVKEVAYGIPIQIGLFLILLFVNNAQIFTMIDLLKAGFVSFKKSRQEK